MLLSIFMKGIVKMLRGCLQSSYSCLEFIPVVDSLSLIYPTHYKITGRVD